ncbi:MAG TPA: NEW3 domain-containing protein [Bauldia sp.]|nr:NEW3 domain-containing protein [Bauldia sp.]
MLGSKTALGIVLIAGALVFAPAAFAQTADTSTDTTAAAPMAPPPPATVAQPVAAPQPLQGLWLTTSYPSLTENLGSDSIQLPLTIQNKGQPPRRVELSVTGLPAGWTYEIDGGGNPVSAAYANTDSDQSLTLKVSPAKDAKFGTYQFQVTGKADADTLTLPLTVVLAQPKPATVEVTPKLPALRGSPTSAFDFDVDIKNDGTTDQTFNLLSNAPAGFEVSFTEQYGSQELTSAPIKAGATSTFKVSVKPPHDVSAGQYTVGIAAATPDLQGQAQLLLDITGQPDLSLSAPDGRLSGDATAGQARTFKLTLHNGGSAPAQNVKFSADPPSNWKVDFNPATIDAVPPGQDVDVSVDITPPDNAIAGDYMVGVNGNADGNASTANFRVTVETSTMWGIWGLAIIAAAVIVLAAAVTRYGRR